MSFILQGQSLKQDNLRNFYNKMEVTLMNTSTGLTGWFYSMIWISTMTYLMTEMTYFMTEPGEAALLGCGIQGTLAEVTEEVFL